MAKCALAKLGANASSAAPPPSTPPAAFVATAVAGGNCSNGTGSNSSNGTANGSNCSNSSGAHGGGGEAGGGGGAEARFVARASFGELRVRHGGGTQASAEGLQAVCAPEPAADATPTGRRARLRRRLDEEGPSYEEWKAAGGYGEEEEAPPKCYCEGQCEAKPVLGQAVAREWRYPSVGRISLAGVLGGHVRIASYGAANVKVQLVENDQAPWHVSGLSTCAPALSPNCHLPLLLLHLLRPLLLLLLPRLLSLLLIPCSACSCCFGTLVRGCPHAPSSPHHGSLSLVGAGDGDVHVDTRREEAPPAPLLPLICRRFFDNRWSSCAASAAVSVPDMPPSSSKQRLIFPPRPPYRPA